LNRGLGDGVGTLGSTQYFQEGKLIMKKILIAAAGVLASLPAMASVPVPESDTFSMLAIGLAGVVAARLLRK
jgi:hypothetical protein